MVSTEAGEVGRDQLRRVFFPVENHGFNSESYEKPLRSSRVTRLELQALLPSLTYLSEGLL